MTSHGFPHGIPYHADYIRVWFSSILSNVKGGFYFSLSYITHGYPSIIIVNYKKAQLHILQPRVSVSKAFRLYFPNQSEPNHLNH